MLTIQNGRMWPGLPEENRKNDLNLPAYFRTIAGNPRFTHEEIGRIVRCIVFDSEAFITPMIEIDVRNLMRHQKVKEATRKKVARFRCRAAGDDSEENKIRKVGRPKTVPSGTPDAILAMKRRGWSVDCESWPGLEETGQKRPCALSELPEVNQDGQHIELAPGPSCGCQEEDCARHEGNVIDLAGIGGSPKPPRGSEYSDEDLIRKMARYASEKTGSEVDSMR